MPERNLDPGPQGSASPRVDTAQPGRGAPATEAEKRIERCILPPERAHADPPPPVDSSDGGSDTREPAAERAVYPWTRQHAAIAIDQAVDAISDLTPAALRQPR